MILVTLLIEPGGLSQTALNTAVESDEQLIAQQLVLAGARDCYFDRLHAIALAVTRQNRQLVRFLATNHVTFSGALKEAMRLSDRGMIYELLRLGAKPDQEALECAFEGPTDILNTVWASYENNADSAALARVLNHAIVKQRLALVRAIVSQNHTLATRMVGRHLMGFEWRNYDIAPMAAAILSDRGESNDNTLALLEYADVKFASVIAGDGNESNRERLASETALLLAIGTGHSNLVNLLIRDGADVNQRPLLGIKRTPLQKAAEVGARSIVQILIQEGADVNGSPCVRGGGTALRLRQLVVTLASLSSCWSIVPTRMHRARSSTVACRSKVQQNMAGSTWSCTS